MDTESERQALIALKQRYFETQQLPHALALKAEIDNGERLSDTDRQFLDEMLRDTERSAGLVKSEFALVMLQRCLVRLYDDILTRDWHNAATASVEKSAKAPGAN